MQFQGVCRMSRHLLLGTFVVVLVLLSQSFSSGFDGKPRNNEFRQSDAYANSLPECDSTNRTQVSIIHVDILNGSDSFSGSEMCPFATISAAVEEAVAGDEIIVHSGSYYEEITISNKDGLTIRAAEGDRVVLDGTRSIKQDLQKSWSQHSGGVQFVDLGLDAWQLFLDYEEQVPARWPNANFSDGSVFNRSHNWAHGTITQGGNEYSNGELIDAGAIEGGHQGLNLSGIDPVGATAILNVGSFKTWSRAVETYDRNYSKITFEEVPGWKTKHHAYFLEGKLEFSDRAGDGFFDMELQRLYFLPPDGQDANILDIRVKTQAFAINVSDSDFVTLDGIDFFGTTFKFYECTGCLVNNSILLYPSTSKRGLGVSGEDDGERWVSRMDRCKQCMIESSAFLYTDGCAIEMHGGDLHNNNNSIKNSYFYHIDWSVSDLPGLMTTFYLGGRDNQFVGNTVHRTGASATISIGDAPTVKGIRAYDTGLLQTDGAVVQMMMAEQDGAEISYNWIHDTEKYGIRMDGPATEQDNRGRNATIHHNVLWNIKGGIMMKGDFHNASNNTVFGEAVSDYNHMIVLHEGGWGNGNSTVASNAADRIAAHRRNSNSSYPLPGNDSIQFNNWNGYDEGNNGESVFSQLTDPLGLDFRPIPGSEIDLMGAGAYSSSDQTPWKAGISWNFSMPEPHRIGCTASEALNHDSNAIFDNGRCMMNDEEVVNESNELLSIVGCTDTEARNFNPSANKDDGSCVYFVGGCMDPDASNYNPEAEEVEECTYSEDFVDEVNPEIGVKSEGGEKMILGSFGALLGIAVAILLIFAWSMKKRNVV